jgi:hypothetical protein
MMGLLPELHLVHALVPVRSALVSAWALGLVLDSSQALEQQ